MPRRYGPAFWPLPETMTANELRLASGLSGRDATRFRQDGFIPLDVADRIACNAGSHVDLMWPEVAWIDEWIEQTLDRTRRWVKRWMTTHTTTGEP